MIRDEAYRTSVEIATEKGVFLRFDKKFYTKGAFIQELPLDIQKDIKKKGIRNSLLLMQAPTGTTSLLSNTTSGIEPVYEFEFIRRDRLGVHAIRHHLYEAWFQKHKEEVENGTLKRPEWFVSANDLSPEDHVRVQGIIQKYVDASISKTVNAPAGHTVEDVKRLYSLAYKLGCKGVTYMRDGSRPGVLERDTKKDEKKELSSPVGYKIPEVKPRPMVVKGSTYQVQTPVGKAYITVNTNGNNEPLEIFINVGKAGTDVTAMAEGLGRMVSLNLRFNSHLTPHERVNRIVDELTGIGGSRSYGFGKDRIRSLPDAVAKVLVTHFAQQTPKQEEKKETVSGEKNGANGASNGNGHSEDKTLLEAVGEVPQQTLEQVHISARTQHSYDLCPDCGVLALAYEEGCKKCYSCGYSEC
jgi:ribonucleoside-diphosphate reductase alpha chain